MMKVATYLPALTVAEAERQWMTPQDVCDLAMIGEETQSETRKFLNNVSERGHVPFLKSGKAKTSPKLYSCLSAVRLRVLREIAVGGRTYDFASPIAEHVAQMSKDIIQRYTDLHQLDLDVGSWLVLYHADRRGQIGQIKTVRSDNLAESIANSGHGYDFGVFAAGSVVWNVLRNYPNYWAKDRLDSGVDRLGRYDGFDEKGFPLDPNHPWNRDLDPVARARRRLEIEEFIARRDERSTDE